MSFANLLTELLSELIVLGLVGLYFIIKNRRTLKKIRSEKEELDLTQLNIETDDQVLLINSYQDLTKEELKKSIQQATVILMKDKDGFYNIVVKNKYGSEGIIQ